MIPEQEYELTKRQGAVITHFYQLVADHNATDYDGLVKLISIISNEIATVNQPKSKKTQTPTVAKQTDEGRASVRPQRQRKQDSSTIEYKTDRTVTVSNPMSKRGERK